MTGLWVRTLVRIVNQKLIIILELILYHLYNIFAYKKQDKTATVSQEIKK